VKPGRPPAYRPKVRAGSHIPPPFVVLTDEGISFFDELTAGRAGGEIMLRKANGEAWRASDQLDAIRAGAPKYGFKSDPKVATLATKSVQ
jgi:hypothetical protein